MTPRRRHNAPRSRTRSLFWGWVVIAALPAAKAAADVDARALAMGEAHTAAARGLAAAAWNPAGLALSRGASLRLAGVAFDVHNNSFSLGRYNEVSGQELTYVDKQRLLADIPQDGFRLDAGVRAGALGLQIGRFALSTGAVAVGRGQLDRDVFDIVLFGNEPDQTVDFSDTWGDGLALGKLSVSWGQQIHDGPLGRLAVGATASYLRGFYELRVEESRGSVTTGPGEIGGEAYLSALTAEDGEGYGLDLGAAWLAPGGWTVGLALDNALARLSWRGEVERTEYRVTASQINLLNDQRDDGIADHDTSYAVAGLATHLPRTLRLGAARDSGRWLVAADYVQGFTDRAGTSTKPRLNVGAEWRPLAVLAPRAGLSLGGHVGASAAGGFGLRLGFWHIDVAVMSRGGLGGSATRGVGFGLSTQLMF